MSEDDGCLDPDPDIAIPTVQPVVNNGKTEHSVPAPVNDMDSGRTFSRCLKGF